MVVWPKWVVAQKDILKVNPTGFRDIDSKKGIEKDSQVLDLSNWKGKFPLTNMGGTRGGAHFEGNIRSLVLKMFK